MKKIFTLFLLSFSLYLAAAVPTDYYNSADGKNTSALRAALQTIISKGTTDVGYGGLWTAYATTDENSSGKIWDMYSNCSFTYSTKQCGSYSVECDCYNREHTSPQSWFNSNAPMVSDLFNVYPTDGKVNGERNNYPYGEVGTATYTSGNGSKLGPSSFSGYTGVVFEPVDDYKGDFARTYFYMATRYASVCQSWASGAEVVYGSNLGFTTYAMNLFLKWSRQDPVSAKEIARNNAVYGIQNNRNPFIDYPGLEEYIWGNKTNSTFSTNVTSTPYISSPSSGTTIDFGKIAYQQTGTASVMIQGVNLTGDLTLALSGTNSSNFSLPVNTISQANAQAGYNLVINYSAQVLGTQTATLGISGGGVTTVTVTLSATSTDSFIALAATNINNTGFNANWTSSANATGYTLNVFSMAGNIASVPQTLLEEDFAGTTLPVGWSKAGYIDFTLASNVKMGSSSQIGQITTPIFNMSAPTTLLVRAKQYGTDNGAKLTASVDNQSLAVWTTGTTNQDFTVNIPAETSTSTISLSAASGSGNRVYVDYIKVTTQGVSQTPVSVYGFPKSVGNVLTYAVTALQSDSTYYYTVAPEGNSTTISDRIKVHTTISTGLNEELQNRLVYRISNEGIQVINLPEGCKVNVLDMIGKHISSVNKNSSEMTFRLSQKGLYILQIQKNKEFKTYKIIY